MKNTSNRFKIHWATWIPEEKTIGNAFGYAVHNNTLRKYVEKIADITPEAEDVLFIVAPEFFKGKVLGKRNWLFTMFEAETMPEEWVVNIQRADFLITPSTWVRDLFSKWFDKEKIFVVSHGVEPVFAYKKRKIPHNKPFRFLWVGAPNPRKGWEEVIAIWEKTDFAKLPGVELYLKTTKYPKVSRRGNVILDGRKLSTKDLIRLYHSAHCFIFPTRGEGFGLTLAEAMRTGLPCIATEYSGVTDFFDETVGYPVSHFLDEVDIIDQTGEKVQSVTGAFPKVEEIVERMIEVVGDYRTALKKGERASKRIRSKFTWPLAAQRLVNIMQEQTC